MREVYFLLLPRVMSLDVTGQAEVLTIAGGFRLHYIGPQPDVMTSTGLTLGHIEPLPAPLPDDSLVFVPGVSNSSKQLDTPQAQSVRQWLQRHRPRFHSGCWPLVCICSGALLAARAGLLDGYCCTTHHQVMARRRPCCAIIAFLSKIGDCSPAPALPPASIWRCIL